VLTDTTNVWVVAYIDPSCGSCKRLALHWERLTTLQTITVRKVKFGYIDVTDDVNVEIIGAYTTGGQIEHTPTIYAYGPDNIPYEYIGDYDDDLNLTEFVCTYCDQNGLLHDHGHGHLYGHGHIAAVPVAGKQIQNQVAKVDYLHEVIDNRRGNGFYDGEFA